VAAAGYVSNEQTVRHLIVIQAWTQ